MGLPALATVDEVAVREQMDLTFSRAQPSRSNREMFVSASERFKNNLTELVVEAIQKKATAERLTQKNIGDLLGIDQPSVSAFLRSKHDTSIARLVEFAEKLDIALTLTASVPEPQESFPTVKQVYPILRVR